MQSRSPLIAFAFNLDVRRLYSLAPGAGRRDAEKKRAESYRPKQRGTWKTSLGCQRRRSRPGVACPGPPHTLSLQTDLRIPSSSKLMPFSQCVTTHNAEGALRLQVPKHTQTHKGQIMKRRGRACWGLPFVLISSLSRSASLAKVSPRSGKQEADRDPHSALWCLTAEPLPRLYSRPRADKKELKSREEKEAESANCPLLDLER